MLNSLNRVVRRDVHHREINDARRSRRTCGKDGVVRNQIPVGNDVSTGRDRRGQRKTYEDADEPQTVKSCLCSF